MLGVSTFHLFLRLSIRFWNCFRFLLGFGTVSDFLLDFGTVSDFLLNFGTVFDIAVIFCFFICERQITEHYFVLLKKKIDIF